MAGFSVTQRAPRIEETGVAGQLPKSVVTVAQSDVFSRTHVVAPAIPTVMDSPWNALCDGSTVDTVAVQAAVDAVSARGTSQGNAVPLLFPPGRASVLGRIIPKSYVDIRAHGHLIKRDPGFTNDHPIFFLQPGIGFGTIGTTRFSLRGARLNGTGSETAFQGLAFLSSGSFFTVEDCELSGLGGVGMYISDSQNVWVERNKLINVASSTSANAITLNSGAGGNTSPLKQVWCNRNLVTGFASIGIDLVGSFSNRTDPVLDAHITNNTCIGTATSGWAMGIEQGGSTPPNVSDIDISGNTLINPNGAGYALALTQSGSPLSSDPLVISHVTVTGNKLVASGTGGIGMICCGSFVAITGNDIQANVDDILLRGTGGAVIHDHKIIGNTGQLGSGKHVNANPFNSVDTTKLTVVP